MILQRVFKKMIKNKRNFTHHLFSDYHMTRGAGKQDVINKNNWRNFASSEVTLQDKSRCVAHRILLFKFLSAVQNL